ncbi:cytochrome P450 [Aspergillus ellipticus CBS 707.79]|uniref:Cytochrome P450 n=1 Tax=Aspergillus ellipticus CBS 707.79 TaxID=1448320 RepID=A0A319DKJ0_9EURO|nr:cytochrome P450 [Aspergillus ellipticus CBS 707.79]
MSETLSSCLFEVACVLLVVNELYHSLFQSVAIIKICKIVGDFRNHRYYRPWAPKPVMIPATKKIMTELSETAVLSQRAVYADMFGFKYTLNGLNHSEINTRKSRLYSRVLQVRGPTQFQELYPYLDRNLRAFMDLERLSSSAMGPEGTISIQLASFSERLLSRLMSAWFFGENMTSDSLFRNALLSHPRQIKSCAAAFQLTPTLLAPFVHSIITRRGNAMRLIQHTLNDTIAAGIERWDEPPEIKKVCIHALNTSHLYVHTITNILPQQLTLLHQLIDLSEPNRTYWTPETLSQAILGLWLAASHQPWVNLHAILLELCVRPEWQDALRKEALEHQGNLASMIDHLPLLDSFMRETARFNALDKVAIRRKALTDYTFTSGSPIVRAGSVLCVSSYDLTRNSNIYPDPNHFDGMRFINGRCRDASSRFADVSENHLIWGYGSLACPGRNHASFILKMVVVHLVINYTMRLADPGASRWWAWEDFTMPYESTKVFVTRRG